MSTHMTSRLGLIRTVDVAGALLSGLAVLLVVVVSTDFGPVSLDGPLTISGNVAPTTALKPVVTPAESTATYVEMAERGAARCEAAMDACDAVKRLLFTTDPIGSPVEADADQSCPRAMEAAYERMMTSAYAGLIDLHTALVVAPASERRLLAQRYDAAAATGFEVLHQAETLPLPMSIPAVDDDPRFESERAALTAARKAATAASGVEPFPFTPATGAPTQ